MVDLFLNGVARQAEDALSRAERLNQILITWRLQTVGFSSPLPHQLIDHLARNPFMTINKTAESMGVAFTTVQRAIEKLEKLGIVTLQGDAKRNRVYCAKAILEILEEPANLISSDLLQ